MKSLRIRFFMYFMLFVLIIGVLLIIGIQYYISDYYYGQKVQTMTTTIESIEKMYRVSTSEDEALQNIDYLGYNFEGKITIIDENSNMLVYQNKEYQYTQGKIIKKIHYKTYNAYIYVTSYPVEGAQWLIYAAPLYNNKLAMLQIPVAAIDDAIAIVQKFNFLLISMAVFIGIIISIILSRSIAKPIGNLNKIAKQIGDLDFNIKYTGRRKDEIGQLGETLNNLANQLEMTITDLQHELQKEKQLESLRKNFVAQVSHELQTPISIISGYLEALSDGIVEEDEMEYHYEIIEDEVQKMSKMVKDLLSISQLESGTYKMSMEPIDLSRYIYELVKKYRLICEKNQVELHEEIEQVPFVFYGDALRLEQGIMNILSNALKHCEKKITINFSVQDNSGQLKIENDGDFIDEEDISHIWKSFYKGKSVKKKEGTGLGLAIASNIFNYHKMTYEVHNLDKSKGVSFCLKFFGK